MTKPEPKSAPVCWWCKGRIDPSVRTIGQDPQIQAPHGVVICSPACPSRPLGMRVWRHDDWRTA